MLPTTTIDTTSTTETDTLISGMTHRVESFCRVGFVSTIQSKIIVFVIVDARLYTAILCNGIYKAK